MICPSGRFVEMVQQIGHLVRLTSGFFALSADKLPGRPTRRALSSARWVERKRYPSYSHGDGFREVLNPSYALRRTRGARLPSPRHDVHRSLRIPGLREGDDSPLSTSSRRAVQDDCSTRRLSTQRISPCGLSATFQTRSQPCACG